jgi:hypothetical protein
MTTTNITKLQRAVLEAAAIRNELSAWPVRGKIYVGTATRTVKQLVRMGLVAEKPAAAKAPVWREDDDRRPLMAVISNDGHRDRNGACGQEGAVAATRGTEGRCRGRQGARGERIARRSTDAEGGHEAGDIDRVARAEGRSDDRRTFGGGGLEGSFNARRNIRGLGKEVRGGDRVGKR